MTSIVHLDFAPRVDPQVLEEMLKFPVVEAEIPVSGALSLLVRVNFFAALLVPALVVGNFALTGVKVASAVPVPESATVCGLLGALSLNVSEPVRAPACVGVKLTLTMHLPLIPSWFVQVLVVMAKSPLATTLVNFRFALPVLVTVTVLTFEVWPTASLPKAKEAGVIVAIGAGPTVS